MATPIYLAYQGIQGREVIKEIPKQAQFWTVVAVDTFCLTLFVVGILGAIGKIGMPIGAAAALIVTGTLIPTLIFALGSLTLLIIFAIWACIKCTRPASGAQIES